MTRKRAMGYSKSAGLGAGCGGAALAAVVARDEEEVVFASGVNNAKARRDKRERREEEEYAARTSRLALKSYKLTPEECEYLGVRR